MLIDSTTHVLVPYHQTLVHREQYLPNNSLTLSTLHITIALLAAWRGAANWQHRTKIQRRWLLAIQFIVLEKGFLYISSSEWQEPLWRPGISSPLRFKLESNWEKKDYPPGNRDGVCLGPSRTRLENKSDGAGSCKHREYQYQYKIRCWYSR
jgi:hypothetical protein